MEPRAEKATQRENNDAEAALTSGTPTLPSGGDAANCLLSVAHGAQYGTVTKIELILCPIHLSFRWSTIPLSVFLFLYNEGLWWCFITRASSFPTLAQI